MKKKELLTELRRLTAHLPQEEADKFTQYYSEIISDAMEDGMSEEEAVASLGSIEEIGAYINENNNFQSGINVNNTTAESKKKGLPAWAIMLIVLGFPIWFSLLCTAFAVYISGWAVLISLFAADLSIFLSGIVLIPASVISTPDFAWLLIALGTGIFCIGISLIMFVGLIKLSGLYSKATKYILKTFVKFFKGD